MTAVIYTRSAILYLGIGPNECSFTTEDLEVHGEAFFLESPDRPLVWRELELPEPGPGEVVVEVAACGLCHTDLSFASGSVAPRHALPLVLGHEVTGWVAAAGEGAELLLWQPVLVPAVLPCGDCSFCRSGRSNICPNQKMPGNDIHGGFATHLLVPGRFVVPLDEAPDGLSIEDIAVVSDAVSTAFQAVRRSGLRPGDAAFVVGAGGVGAFVVQIARALGARVVACDVQSDRLDLVARHGAEVTVVTASREERELRRELQGIARDWDVPSVCWRIFETSGTPEGQSLSFALLAPAATMVQVGFTPAKVTVRLSNLMAFDATVHGSWGCPPEVYSEVLDLIYREDVLLSPFVEHAPMEELNRLLDDMAQHRLSRRMILRPGRP